MDDKLTPCDVKSWFGAIHSVCTKRFEMAFELMDELDRFETDREERYNYDHWYVHDDNQNFMLVGYNHKFDGTDQFDVNISYFIPFADIIVDLSLIHI